MHDLLGELQPDPQQAKLMSSACLIHSRAWCALPTVHSRTSTWTDLQAPIPRPNQNTQQV